MFKEVAHNSDPVSPQSHLTYFHTYNVFLTLAQYVLPLTAISFAYARMGTKLWLNKTPARIARKTSQSRPTIMAGCAQEYAEDAWRRPDCCC